MPDPVTKSGRVFAVSNTYSGGAVTATTLYFDDDTTLGLQGHLVLAIPVTVEITYLEQIKKGHKLVSLTLLGGPVA